MTIKALFVDANGDYEESPGVYESSEHVNSSAGVGDAGKPILLNGSGQIDASMLNVDFIKRYLLADYRTTAALPAVTYANGTLGVGATLTADANGAFAAQDGETPAQGDTYLIMDQAAGLQNGIYELTDVGDGSNPFILTRVTAFDETAEIEDGVMVAVAAGTLHADTQWLQVNAVATVGTDALAFSGVVPTNIDAGAGLSFAGSTLNVNAGDGIQFIGDDVAVLASDIAGTGMEATSNNLDINFADTSSEMGLVLAVSALDLSSNGTDQGAYILGADPANISQSSGTDIQQVLEDLSAAIDTAGEQGQTYTTDGVGVTAGDLVYFSGNGIVSVHDDLTDDFRGIGIAKTTVGASASVKVLANQETLAGILTSATAGDRYFWTGSAHSTTIPPTSSAYVWTTGIAENADDLYIWVDFVKKNAA